MVQRGSTWVTGYVQQRYRQGVLDLEGCLSTEQTRLGSLGNGLVLHAPQRPLALAEKRYVKP